MGLHGALCCKESIFQDSVAQNSRFRSCISRSGAILDQEGVRMTAKLGVQPAAAASPCPKTSKSSHGSSCCKHLQIRQSLRDVQAEKVCLWNQMWIIILEAMRNLLNLVGPKTSDYLQGSFNFRRSLLQCKNLNIHQVSATLVPKKHPKKSILATFGPTM